MLLAMHLPDHVLSTEVAAATALATAAAAVGHRLQRRSPGRTLNVSASQSAQQFTASDVALVASLVFAGQMVNFAIPGLAVSGHFLGAATAGLLLGPWLGTLVVAAVLVVQCLLFGDGGVTALGANVFNMAVVGCGSAWAVSRAMAIDKAIPSRRLAIVALAGWVSTMAAAVVCAMELSLSDAAAAVGPLLRYHAAIGFGEALLTAMLVTSLSPARGIGHVATLRTSAAWLFTACAVLLVPLASLLPDGLDAALATAGIGERGGAWQAPLADYAAPGWLMLNGTAATMLIAVLGAGGAFALVWCLGRMRFGGSPAINDARLA